MQIIKNDCETCCWTNSKKYLLYLLYSIYIENDLYSIKWYTPVILYYIIFNYSVIVTVFKYRNVQKYIEINKQWLEQICL